MKPSAVLLVDLENFYCSREDYCRSNSPSGYDRTRFARDLDKLLRFARAMVGSLPLTVRRAYANFNAARYPSGSPQYYLRHIPDELMRQGVEPVQVFRLSQSSSKNAADMRLAMDATAMLDGVGHIEHFVLVTGDADFIPLILELKRHGHAVSVIGVSNATNALIQRFVDNFELFEDLLAAEEVKSPRDKRSPAADITPVTAANFAPSSNGVKLTPQSQQKKKPALSADEMHTPANYMKLLKAGGAKGSETESYKILPVPWPSVQRVCADVFPLLHPSSGTPTPRDLLTVQLAEASRGLNIERYEQHVRRSLGILRISGDLVESDGTVALHPEVTSALDLRNRALAFLLQLLQLRLEEREQFDPIRPRAFVEALDAGPLAESLLEEIQPVIDWIYKVESQDQDPVLSNSEPNWNLNGDAVQDEPPRSPLEAISQEAGAVVPVAQSPIEISMPTDREPPPKKQSGVVDVAAITSEAVAASTSIPPHTLEPIEAEMPVAELSSQSDVGTVDDDDVLLAVQIASWLPESDPFAQLDSVHDQLVSGSLSGTRLVPLPQPHADPTPPSVAKINTQPPTSQAPPLPPESA